MDQQGKHISFSLARFLPSICSIVYYQSIIFDKTLLRELLSLIGFTFLRVEAWKYLFYLQPHSDRGVVKM